MLGRFFNRHTGGNWRPPSQELAFAAQAGFDTLQVQSRRPGELEDELGVPAVALGALYDELGVEPALEMLVRHEGEPGTFARALKANLDAIEAAGFLRVHIHPVGPEEAKPHLARDLAEAAAVAADVGLIFGVEHNAPGHRLLVGIEEVEALLEQVPTLGLVWDINHTPADEVDRFLALQERFTLVHVSDTPLPETNHHLPLGRGRVDFSQLPPLDDVPFVLEIGGLPHSGGPGLDTDEALLESLAFLRTG
jgi:L-ribulose-5-phosphate 3-epimerase